MRRTGRAAWAAVMLALSVGAATAAQDRNGVGAAYEAALAVTPIPRSLGAERASWAREDDGDPDARARRIETLTAQAARDRRVRGLRPGLADLSSGCIDIGLKGCVSESGGYLARRDGPTLYWQVQDGFTDEDGISSGFVLLTSRPDGRTLEPLAWNTAPARYEPPRWVDAGEDETILSVPGVYHGSGGHNADLLFRWNGRGALVQIDNLAWRAELDARLPEGLEVWQGVDFIEDGFSARTALWRSDDGNCCPSGGSAMLSFDIRDDRMILTDVRIRDALAELAARTPADVFDWIGRAQGCAHWSGEEPYDPERAARIAAALHDLRCDALEADERTVRAAHADRPALLEAMNRVRAL